MLDVEKLLAPIGSEKPCGDDLEYDAAMLALEQAAQTKAERQFGDTVIAAQEPDWRDVQVRCEELFARTKNLHVAVLLARSWLKQRGYIGFVQGLALIEGLISRYWDQLYPALDPDDKSPAVRLNTLAPLAVDDAGLARDMLHEVQFAPLDGALGKAGLRVRDLELALGKAKPDPQEAVPTEEGVLQGLTGMLAGHPDLAAGLLAGQAHADRLLAVLDTHAEAPNLNALQGLARLVATAVGRASGATTGGAANEANAGNGAVHGAVAVGEIRSREDAIRVLDRVCEWFGRNEPSHPAPLVIRRAQRLMKKDFIEIIKDLAPDGLKQVEDVIGREESQE